jgi:hypothetical protein
LALLHAAQDLRDLLSPQDHPQWLGPLFQASYEYSQNPQANAREFLTRLVKQHRDIRPIVVSTDTTPLLDFDALYVHFRDEGRIPELFDKLIQIISQIIDDGHIDSITALEALRQIIVLLRTNRNGSYLAARQSVTIARYLRNLAKVVLEKVPLVKELLEVYDRTIEEIDDEFGRLEERIKDETMLAIARAIPRLAQLPKYADQSVRLLANSAEEDVIDGEFEVPIAPK